MNVVAILGSPRPRASSNKLAQRFLDVAASKGAEVDSFILNDLQFIGCQGCYGCKRVRDVCVIKDDLTPVLSAVEKCDVLVLTSPVYIHDVTGQMKCFIDRTFSYLTPEFHTSPDNASRLGKGKKLFFLQTQGNPDEKAFSDVPPRYEHFFKVLGFDVQTMIVAGIGLQENLLESRPELVKTVEGVAGQMLAK